MSEEPAEDKNTPDKIYPTPLKRFMLTIAGLFVFLILFGQIIPRLLFKEETKVPTDTTKTAKITNNTITVTNPIDGHNLTKNADLEIPPPNEDIHVENKSNAMNESSSGRPPEPESKSPSETDAKYLQEMEEKIASLQTTYETKITELKNKLETQNMESQNKADSIISSLVIFSELKDAVNSGKPYVNELNRLKGITFDNTKIVEKISLLESSSNTGVITSDKLKDIFPSLIKKALTNNDENVWLKILHRFITVRKVGNQSGDSDEAILARAEIKLATNDVLAVFSELEQLSPPAKEIFKDWLEDANNLIKTKENMYELQLLLAKTPQTSHP